DLAKASAVARPIPVVPPITSTFLPEKSYATFIGSLPSSFAAGAAPTAWRPAFLRFAVSPAAMHACRRSPAWTDSGTLPQAVGATSSFLHAHGRRRASHARRGCTAAKSTALRTECRRCDPARTAAIANRTCAAFRFSARYRYHARGRSDRARGASIGRDDGVLPACRRIAGGARPLRPPGCGKSRQDY